MSIVKKKQKLMTYLREDAKNLAIISNDDKISVCKYTISDTTYHYTNEWTLCINYNIFAWRFLNPCEYSFFRNLFFLNDWFQMHFSQSLQTHCCLFYLQLIHHWSYSLILWLSFFCLSFAMACISASLIADGSCFMLRSLEYDWSNFNESANDPFSNDNISSRRSSACKIKDCVFFK